MLSGGLALLSGGLGSLTCVALDGGLDVVPYAGTGVVKRQQQFGLLGNVFEVAH